MSLVFFLVGAALAAFGIGAAVERRRQNAWPVARGSVLGGEVFVVGGHFVGLVRYAYALRPVSAYRGTDHPLEGRFESVPFRERHGAEAHVSQYRAGEPVDVRYDPAHPSRSTLGRAPERMPFSAFLVAVGLVVATVSAFAAFH